MSSKTEESGSILRYLHAYTTHLLFARTIERDLLLIKKVQAQLEQLNNDDKKYQAKLEELVKLYDTIVQVNIYKRRCLSFLFLFMYLFYSLLYDT